MISILDLLEQLIPVLTVLAGASITLFITSINNRHARNLQRDQWAREDQKSEIEAKRLAEKNAIEQRAKDRQAIIENYAQAIAYLTVIVKAGRDMHSQTVTEALEKVHPHLLQIQISYPDKTNEIYKILRGDIDHLTMSHINIADTSESMRSTILDLADIDPRL